MLSTLLTFLLLPCTYSLRDGMSDAVVQPDKSLNSIDFLLRISQSNNTTKNVASSISAKQQQEADAVGRDYEGLPTEEAAFVKSMQNQYTTSCPDHKYSVRFFSHKPLIWYIEDFVSSQERAYLMHIASSKYEPSTVGDEARSTSKDRTSTTATPYDDPIADCIRQRAAHFQGLNSAETVEVLQVVKYAVGQQYKHHYDWASTHENPRVSTFFVYAACDGEDAGSSEDASRSDSLISEEFSVDTVPAKQNSLSSPSTSCKGGATNFPRLRMDWNKRNSWCDVVDCDNDPKRRGISFKPIPGNAIFWSNVHADGTYDQKVWHAGVPVESGTKIGLNLWTRRFAIFDDED